MYQADTSPLYYMLYMIYLQPAQQAWSSSSSSSSDQSQTGHSLHCCALQPSVFLSACVNGLTSLILPWGDVVSHDVICHLWVDCASPPFFPYPPLVNCQPTLTVKHECMQGIPQLIFCIHMAYTKQNMRVTRYAKSTQPAEPRMDIQKQWFYNPRICLCECTHSLCCLGGWQSSFFPLASIMDQACCQKACIAWGKFPFVGACGSEALNPL